jgi:hypothetical protein
MTKVTTMFNTWCNNNTLKIAITFDRNTSIAIAKTIITQTNTKQKLQI